VGRKKIEIKNITLTRGGKEIGSGYDLLKKLASLGLTQAQIAAMLSFSERTLRNRLKEDERAAEAYDAGRAEVAYEIANRHRTIALHGSEKESRLACEFWLERQFDWTKSKPEAVGHEPGTTGVLVVPMPMTIEEWEAAAIAQQRAVGAIAEREVHRLKAPRDEDGEGD
jgi:hypothetical protein